MYGARDVVVLYIMQGREKLVDIGQVSQQNFN